MEAVKRKTTAVYQYQLTSIVARIKINSVWIVLESIICHFKHNPRAWIQDQHKILDLCLLNASFVTPYITLTEQCCDVMIHSFFVINHFTLLFWFSRVFFRRKQGLFCDNSFANHLETLDTTCPNLLWFYFRSKLTWDLFLSER